jgi:hypothetical protein
VAYSGGYNACLGVVHVPVYGLGPEGGVEGQDEA